MTDIKGCISMRVFVNKWSGKKFIVMDGAVVEGGDAYFLKDVNISLPKAEWEECRKSDQ